WTDVLQGGIRESLEELLPPYFRDCGWFRGGDRQIEKIRVVHTLPTATNAASPQVTLARVEYTEGEPETYVLPLAYVADAGTDNLATQPRQGLIARLAVKSKKASDSDGKPGLLYDPLGDKNFLRGAAEAIVQQRQFRRNGGQMEAVTLSGLEQFYHP